MISCFIGKRMVKQDPAPTVLSTLIDPPARRRISRVIDRPSPVPLAPLVEKNGSKTLARTSSDMPVPVSHTSITTMGRAQLSSR